MSPANTMKTLTFCLLLLATASWCGCSTPKTTPAPRDKSPEDELKSREEVSYFDRNGDHIIDQEKHHYRGVADADWELRDDDYNGRYEKKILYGVGVIESKVNISVPHTHIETQP